MLARIELMAHDANNVAPLSGTISFEQQQRLALWNPDRRAHKGSTLAQKLAEVEEMMKEAPRAPICDSSRARERYPRRRLAEAAQPQVQQQLIGRLDGSSGDQEEE